MTTKFTVPVLLIGGGADRTNVRYATGFDAPDPFLCLLSRHRRILLVSLLELGRARALQGDIESLTPADLTPASKKGRLSFAQQAVALCRHLKLDRIQLSPDCPAVILRALEKAGLQVIVRKTVLFPTRTVKSPGELRHLRESQRAAVAAMKAAIAQIQKAKPGTNGFLTCGSQPLSAEDVRNTIDHVLLDHNCIADETIVAGAEQGVDPHERGFGPLPAHQPIVLDIFPRHRTHGYWGDITRTVLNGKPTARQRAQYRSVLRAQQHALSMVKPGTTGAEIHAAVENIFNEDGFATGVTDGVPQGFFHGTGHGVGLEIHESPSVSPVGAELEAGNVITIEPGLYYPGLGGVRIEDTVVVTETGYRMLASCPKRFVL